MNQQQRKYATNRIKDISNAKIAKLNLDFTSNPDNRNPAYPYNCNTFVEKLAIEAFLGRSSTYRLKTPEEVAELEKNGELRSLRDLFDTPESKELSKYNSKVKEIAERKKKEVDSKVSLIQADASLAIDTLIFGDNEAALKVLKDFEDKVY